MKIFVDSMGNIHDVEVTTDESLIELEINDDTNPFAKWTVDKICCYRVAVSNGEVTMMTPAVDSRLIEHWDRGGKDHNDNSEGIFDVAELAGENSEAAYDLAEYVGQLEELVAALDERVTALEEKNSEQEEV